MVTPSSHYTRGVLSVAGGELVYAAHIVRIVCASIPREVVTGDVSTPGDLRRFPTSPRNIALEHAAITEEETSPHPEPLPCADRESGRGETG